MYYVIGSGPTGVAAASALLDRGLPVTMLDVGTQCEPERLAAVERMRGREPAEWSPQDLAAIRPAALSNDSIPLKLSYGSTFPYALDEMTATVQQGTRCLLTFAQGGLSNVWGAAVLPSRAADCEDWPVTADDLAPHYARVAAMMPIAGAADELSELFPYHASPAAGLRPSTLAARMMARLRERRPMLEAHGLFFGQSRLAVSSEGEHACRYTGLCLSGCPELAIWSSRQALDQLVRRPGFHYRAGFFVERLESAEGDVRVIGRAEGAGRESLTGRRAFLACGPVSTMRIIYDSLRCYDAALDLQYQPFFLLPMLSLHDGGAVTRERLHTLAQIFIEILDPRVSRYTVHLQVYTFNEYIEERVGRVTRGLGPLRPAADRALLSRLLAVQGYLHSREGAGIRVTAHHDAGAERARLTLAARSEEGTTRVMRRVRRKLARHAWQLGAIPLWPLASLGKPGDGNHSGAVFPSSRTPSGFESDLTGQLPALPRVHIVDSSVLTSLPATTFTYTAMANAHRIATAAAALP